MPEFDDEHVADLLEMRSSLSRVFEEIAENNRTTAGVVVSPESSLKCSAVLCCVRVLSESIASMPFNLYRRLPGGGKEIAEDQPLQEVIAYQPNDWMTSFEWREWMMSQLLLWGNAYSLIRPGRRGAVDQLIPLHASRMTIVRLENGRLQYQYKEPGQAEPKKYRQDQVFHLRWLSSDGVTGYVPTSLASDAIALARATELHSSAFFGNGAQFLSNAFVPTAANALAEKCLAEIMVKLKNVQNVGGRLYYRRTRTVDGQRKKISP